MLLELATAICPLFFPFGFDVNYTVICDREVVHAVYSETTDEIDNTSGTTAIEQNLSLLRQFSPGIELELHANSGLDRGEVRDRILDEYQLAGAEQQKQCVIPISVPAGASYTYKIQWTEIASQGWIEEGTHGGGEILGTYSIITDMRCEVVSYQVVQAANGERVGSLHPAEFSSARPSALILETTDLLSQPLYPAGTEPLVLAEIESGESVIVFNIDDNTRSWFRELWQGDGEQAPVIGWLRAESVNYSPRRANLSFAPPGCTQALGWLSSLDDEWESTVQGRVMVVVDLYRDTSATAYPESTFFLTRNGRELRDDEFTFHSAGYFLMDNVAIFADFRVGDVIGFSLVSESEAPLHLSAALYQIPQGCDFGE